MVASPNVSFARSLPIFGKNYFANKFFFEVLRYVSRCVVAPSRSRLTAILVRTIHVRYIAS